MTGRFSYAAVKSWLDLTRSNAPRGLLLPRVLCCRPRYHRYCTADFTHALTAETVRHQTRIYIVFPIFDLADLNS
jgi:hypothetical protein